MPAAVKTETNALTLVAYIGDAKTLLAFNLPKQRAKNLAGFTIECRPQGQTPYYLQNSLRFEHPEQHAQDASEPPTSSINAPLHKFRWLHVPGSIHQALKPFYGPYNYVVTPRYFDDRRSLQPIDPGLSASIDIDVGPFETMSLGLGFTRGYVQSQGFVNHFGLKALIRPKDKELLFDPAKLAGTNASGVQYSYADEYEWLGFTAREKIFALLDAVLADDQLRLDMFAYDLNEPDLLKRLLDLAKQGRIRIILDNAALHHSAPKPKPEDEFEALFVAAAMAPAEIRRGHFGRYAHDKVLIVSDAVGARTVLTGSTNFSVTGLYVNSNHVLVFTDKVIAAKYLELFEAVWAGEVKAAAYLRSPLAGETFSTANGQTPPLEITFAPHSTEFATEILDNVVARIEKEGKKGPTVGSVLFAVMAIDKGTSPVYQALNALHANERIFSFGISDSPAGISLYSPGRKTGVLVTGKPVRTQLPAPFNQVPNVGAGHQIHHKFVVCGFNGSDPVVYCGSSNLAPGGEQRNGDNLLEIHDSDVATASRSRHLRSSITSSSSTGRPGARKRRRSLPRHRRKTPPCRRGGSSRRATDGRSPTSTRAICTTSIDGSSLRASH
jgi:phosphatidylserine/phosphatidylglycerophosphate/cardiolipin synthase-like enzyme